MKIQKYRYGYIALLLALTLAIGLTVQLGSATAADRPDIQILNPGLGPVGVLVKVVGTSFTATGNDIHFGVGGIKNLSSTENGTKLYFNVPSVISACDFTATDSGISCNTPSYAVAPGDYKVYVVNKNGTSTEVIFTVTNASPSPTPMPTGDRPDISYISPGSAPVGASVKIVGSSFLPTGNTIHFGIGSFNNVSSTKGGTIMEFQIPEYLSNCSNVACTSLTYKVTPGDYQVYISNTNGSGPAITFTVMSSDIKPSTTPTPMPRITPRPTPEPCLISGGVCPTPEPIDHNKTYSASEIRVGDTISASNSSDPDVYIVNESGYKRLFLNPIIFSFYGHLGGFSNVRPISATTRDEFVTSGLFRNCETNDPKIYAVQATGEDTGTLHWLNESGSVAVAEDSSFFKKVFCINNKEFNWYTQGSVYTSVNQIPSYSR